ncbi:MAG: hypothetical protein JKY65_24035 [Planctomycetes bacterium]|nr:hypothetical protein [Planctomycetota bacterium]
MDEELDEIQHLIQSGHYGDADRRLAIALVDYPGEGRVRGLQASLSLYRWGLFGQLEGRPVDDPRLLDLREQAQRHLDAAVALNPDLEIECLLTRAILEFDYDQESALALCREALDLERTALTLGQYANCLGEARRFEESEAVFWEAAEVDQESFVNMVNFGRQMVRKEPPDLWLAAFLFTKATELTPESAEAHYRLGDCYGSIPGHLEEAKHHLTLALSLEPTERLAGKIGLALQGLSRGKGPRCKTQSAIFERRWVS